MHLLYSLHFYNKVLKLDTEDRTPSVNSVLPQLAVTCKIEAECFYQHLCLVDNKVLPNTLLRQEAKRWKILTKEDK